MPYCHINFETGDDGIAVLTVARPEKLNAINAAVMSELEQAFQEFETNPATQALLLTGAGDKAFVAGADIAELATLGASEASQLSSRGQKVFRMLETSRKPSVAALNGIAFGAGLELAMACTLRVAAPHARLGQPEVKLGILPGYGGTQRLPRLVGRGRALELLLTGEPIDATEAKLWGLVNYIAPVEELLNFGRDILLRILRNGPLAVDMSMQTVDAGLNTTLEEGLRLETSAFGLLSSTADCREGMRAFLEKRPALFVGN